MLGRIQLLSVSSFPGPSSCPWSVGASEVQREAAHAALSCRALASNDAVSLVVQPPSGAHGAAAEALAGPFGRAVAHAMSDATIGLRTATQSALSHLGEFRRALVQYPTLSYASLVRAPHAGAPPGEDVVGLGRTCLNPAAHLARFDPWDSPVLNYAILLRGTDYKWQSSLISTLQACQGRG